MPRRDTDHSVVGHHLANDIPVVVALSKVFYDPHEMMARVLEGMLGNGLSYTPPTGGNAGYLTRTPGPCQLCEYWKFPKGCPYGKQPYSNNFLKKVADAIVNPHNAAARAVNF